MNLINWHNEWNLLLETIKRQDFEHVLEKSNRHDLLATMKGVAITSIATGMGSLIGGLVYGPVGALLAGSTTASMMTYGANIKYKSLYEIIKQLSSEEKYQLLMNIKAVLRGVFNEQTIIVGAVGKKNNFNINKTYLEFLVVAKEIYRYICEMKKTGNISNNFMIIEDFDE